LEIGRDTSAKKLMDFINSEVIQLKHNIDKPISERTARRYLNKLEYHWTTLKKGQYTDGHEREDIVTYWNKVFLPKWQQMKTRMRNWSDSLPEIGPNLSEWEVIIWFHNETIFYAHDLRKKRWYHKDTPAKPYAKGEGASFMVADFVTAKSGWLCSPDGTRSAR